MTFNESQRMSIGTTSNPYQFTKQIFSDYVERDNERRMQEIDFQARGLLDKIPSAGKVDFIHRQPKALSIVSKNHKELS